MASTSLARTTSTALLTAYARTFTDIPYATEVFEQAKVLQGLGEDIIPLEWRQPQTAPRFEARYLLINHLMQASGAKQVLELASGLSPRSLNVAAVFNLPYIEVDLPKNTALKQKIIHVLGTQYTIPSNITVVDGDVLDEHRLSKITRDFDYSEPLCVITEGLLRYLTFEQKAALTANIRTLLLRFGGVWITSDTTPEERNSERSLAIRSAKTKEMTGIETNRNLFSDESAATTFFKDRGFEVEVHQLSEATNELVSPRRLGLSASRVEALLAGKHVYVMRLRS